MRSIWLCSRNDALGNAAVMTAAGGVFAVASGWPDIVVAALIAGVNTSAAAQVMRRAIAELRVAGGGISPEYRGVINPLVPTAKVIEEGGVLYQQRCAVCHGAQGMGDGEAARYLNPSPALLAYMVQMPMSVDEYLMWSIAEGGGSSSVPPCPPSTTRCQTRRSGKLLLSCVPVFRRLRNADRNAPEKR